MKTRFHATAGVIAALAASTTGYADRTTFQVQSIKETDEAVFFQYAGNDSRFVGYVPKTEIRITPSPDPSGRYYQAGVYFKRVHNRDLAAINPQWAGKIAQPTQLTVGQECTWNASAESPSEAPSAELFVGLSGRDISASDTGPLCQFNLSIDEASRETVLASLNAQANARTLISTNVNYKLELAQEQSIRFGEVYKWVKNALPRNPVDVSSDEAVFLIGIATAVDTPTHKKVWHFSQNDKRKYISLALKAIFQPFQVQDAAGRTHSVYRLRSQAGPEKFELPSVAEVQSHAL